MEDSLRHCIAESLECDEALLPYMAELLEDLEELGSDPEIVVRLLHPRLKAGARVLDLACGKGTVSVALAARLGCRVVGIDAMPAFLESARSLAERHHAGHLCSFHFGDIRAFQPGEDRFDAVIYGAAGPVLGSLRDTVGRLRELVRPDGLILIDDAWRKVSGDQLPETLAACPTREEALDALTAYGDRIAAEMPVTAEALASINRANNRCIQRRASRLAARHPDKAALFCAYASRQLFECYLLERAYQCVVWLLRVHQFGRGPSKGSRQAGGVSP